MYRFNWKKELHRIEGDPEWNERTKEFEFDKPFLEAVQEFADSDLPNEFFLQQFNETCPKIFRYKKYWNGFAKVLTTRGCEKIKDVREAMLIWLQDMNWPGNEVIIPFVRKNFAFFRETIVGCIQRALYSNDMGWATALLVLYREETGLPTEKEDEWLNKAEDAHDVCNSVLYSIMQELREREENK